MTNQVLSLGDDNIKYLLFFLIAVQIPSSIFGEITVHHKLTKEVVQTIKHEFYPFKSTHTSLNTKGHLIISNPIDACTSINSPPKTDLHSLRKGVILQPSWILLTDDTDCDVHYKIVQAQRQGYTGIIIYSNHSSAPNPMSIQSDLTHLYEVNVSFIGLEDGLELKKYAYSKPYILMIEQDWSLVVGVEDFCNYLTATSKEFILWLQSLPNIADKWTAPVRNAARTTFQILLLTSPIWFLVACNWKNYRRIIFEEQERENVFRERFYYSRQDFNSNSQEQNQHQYSSPRYSSHEGYRKLLGVSEGATKAQIESAFRRKSATYHPDKNRHLLNEGREKELDEKTEMFRMMNNAKDKLLELY